MLPIPLPWLIVGVLVSLFGSYRVGHHYGWLERDNDMKIAIAQKNDEARAKEKELGEKLQDQETQLRKAEDDIKKKQSAMHELARTGRMRLPTASCPQTNANTSIVVGNPQPSDTSQTELERQTIEALIDIAADGDKAIVKLNSCVAAYEEVRRLVNGQ